MRLPRAVGDLPRPRPHPHVLEVLGRRAKLQSEVVAAHSEVYTAHVIGLDEAKPFSDELVSRSARCGSKGSRSSWRIA